MHHTKEIDYLPVTALEYDPENPRLPSSIAGDNEIEVVNWMLTDASITELMGSIGEKGFFPAEPLLVVADKSKKGKKYIVIEGNRRLTAVKLLNNPKLAKKRNNTINQIVREAKEHPKELPAIVFEERDEILDYLGFKHITGVKPWSALAKAKYLKSLQKQYRALPITEQYKSLAKAIGSRADYVKDLLTTLPVYEKIAENDFYDIDNLNEDSIDFGVYYNALKYSNISEYIGVKVEDKNPVRNLKKQNLEKFTRWVSEKDDTKNTRLGESRNLSKLNDILGNTEALNQFEKGRSIDDSLLYTESPYQTFQSLLVEATEKLNQAHSYSRHVKNPETGDIKILDEILGTANDLKTVLTSKLKKKSSSTR